MAHHQALDLDQSTNETMHVPSEHEAMCTPRCAGPQASPAAVRCVHRPAKVGDLELPLQAQQQVLWLDVAVDDVLGVAVVECLG